jgi:sporulation protein YlmC with PRC-barrel domain
MLLSEITRKEVLDVQANKVGNIVDVDLDVLHNSVDHFVLRTGAFKKVNIVPDTIEKIGQKILLKVSKADIAKAPVSSK